MEQPYAYADGPVANNTMAYTLIETVSGATGEVTLREVALSTGKHYELRVNGIYVMATYCQESETALAVEALRLLGRREGARVLVGGLGMGITLREALAPGWVDEVVVVEIESCVVDWCREHFGPYNRNALLDPRARIVCRDIGEYVMAGHDRFDAILLDMDNGPDNLIYSDNFRLYDDDGLDGWMEMLRPGGVLALWAARTDESFERNIRARFEQVEVHEINTSVSLQTESPDIVYCARMGPPTPDSGPAGGPRSVNG